MHRTAKAGMVAALAGILATGVAQAAVTATATADLNVRKGPGPQHEIVGVIGRNEQASVEGCIEPGQWCRVKFDGGSGWAYSSYLSTEQQGNAVAVTKLESVPTVTYDGASAAAGAAGGAIVGALVGGPVGAAVGGAVGAGIGATNPPEKVVSYVREHSYEPVYLEGEPVVGAALPENVELRTIPDYEYRYVYVNGQPVLVQPDNRKIVYVLR